jgi:A/G-specific adenine glycosylase
LHAGAIRKQLLRWYQSHRRDLPWRRTRDPYAIWISEVMLQQTRVAAAIPAYRRFLERFPSPESLARATEQEVLAAWGGLGYYSRARNLHRAARRIAAHGFPRSHAAIRELPGVGDYTAAAVASIAFGLPYAAVDGNARRVLMRLANDASLDVRAEAQRWLDRRDPGRFNQALMELGALVCLPRRPRCGECPLAGSCAARAAGTAASLPPRRTRPQAARKSRRLLVARRGGRILLAPSPRVKGFWELPEARILPRGGFTLGPKIGAFRHSITSSQYRFVVVEATVRRPGSSCRWWTPEELETIPLSTASKKALQCWKKRVAESASRHG